MPAALVGLCEPPDAFSANNNSRITCDQLRTVRIDCHSSGIPVLKTDVTERGTVVLDGNVTNCEVNHRVWVPHIGVRDIKFMKDQFPHCHGRI